MCGIAGIVRFGGLGRGEASRAVEMAETLRHRGPDGTGRWESRVAALGHTRLSIIDLPGGAQPTCNEDGTVQVVFNGEIYNHAQLASTLRSRGHVLQTRCDTEVIPHLYEEYGEDFVSHLNGMFAIALWDAWSRRLLLVRDRLGIKPLYWHDDGQRVLFGSELKALLAAGDIETRVDPCSLVDYLTFGHVPGARTIYAGCRRLEPGCMAICTQGSSRIRRYWDIPVAPEPACGTEADERRWTDEFAALLQDAIALRMVADVPVGAFLSGGIDSASVVAGMCRARGGAVLTHTIGFDEQDHDERMAARQTARALGTDHHEFIVRADAVHVAEHLARHFDEPFADVSAVPTFYLARETRSRVKVALAGDGPDEMLGGYRRYRFDLGEAAVRSHVPDWLRVPAAGLAGMLYPKADWLPRALRARRTLENLACDDATAHLRSVSLRAGALPALLLRPEFAARCRGYDPFLRGRDLYARCPSRDRLSRLLYLDMKTLMVDDILTKVDRASMAVGLEVREPMLDYRVVELAARMPCALRLDKRVLRNVLTDWVGQDVARRSKRGFNVPVDAWFRGPLRAMSHDLLLSPDALCRDFLEPRAIRRLVADHERGLRSEGHVLWALLSLELWARIHVDRTRQPASVQGVLVA